MIPRQISFDIDIDSDVTVTDTLTVDHPPILLCLAFFLSERLIIYNKLYSRYRPSNIFNLVEKTILSLPLIAVSLHPTATSYDYVYGYVVRLRLRPTPQAQRWARHNFSNNCATIINVIFLETAHPEDKLGSV